jgi:excisionase family DNA binding protein
MSSLKTVKQAAELLNLSQSKVYRMTWSGELPVQRIGRSVRIPVSAIDRLAEPEVSNKPDFLSGGAA